MDPVSQAVVGAAAAQVFLTDRLGKQAFACGAVGGLLLDSDVLIRSTADPLLAVEMHRHFTHALALVPIGGLIAALPFLGMRDNRRRWRAIIAPVRSATPPMRRWTCSPPTERCGCGRSAGRVSSSTGCQSWTRSSPFPC